MKKVLIIGADGQLGFDLMRTFGKEAIGLTRQDIEITDQQVVQKVLHQYAPEVVINSAAMTKTEECEVQSEYCFLVNALGAYYVAKAAADVRSAMIFISTDYVFDGKQDGFREGDMPNPLNVYGASKLAGEYLVRIATTHSYIIRSSWFFGFQVSQKGHDFPRLMLRLAKEQPQVCVVNDQIGCPTYTRDLALKIKELLDRNAPYGIYHITNQGQCSWYEFAKKVFEISHTKVDLVPISTNDSPSKIQRPKNSVLRNTKLPQAGLGLLRPWEEALEDYFGELQ